MNLKVEKVKELLLSLEHYLDCMIEVVLNGDDGFQQAVADLQEEYKQTVKKFDLTYMQSFTPLTAVLPVQSNLEMKIDYSDAKAYSIALKSFLKKTIFDNQLDFSEVKNEELFNFLEADLILGSKFQDHYYSKEYFYTSMNVMKDIVSEIEAQRRKAPQQKLF